MEEDEGEDDELFVDEVNVDSDEDELGDFCMM